MEEAADVRLTAPKIDEQVMSIHIHSRVDPRESSRYAGSSRGLGTDLLERYVDFSVEYY